MKTTKKAQAPQVGLITGALMGLNHVIGNTVRITGKVAVKIVTLPSTLLLTGTGITLEVGGNLIAGGGRGLNAGADFISRNGKKAELWVDSTVAKTMVRTDGFILRTAANAQRNRAESRAAKAAYIRQREAAIEA